LIVPASWSATQWTELYVWNSPFTEQAHGDWQLAGLYAATARQGDISAACAAAKLDPSDVNLQSCLFADQIIGGIPAQALSQPMPGVLGISSLPGTSIDTDGKSWSAIKRLDQTDYMQTNVAVYQDFYGTPNLIGLGAYALEMFEAVPSTVKGAVTGVATANTVLQTPWYIGFSPDTIPGSKPGVSPGYDQRENIKIWTKFGKLMQQVK